MKKSAERKFPRNGLSIKQKVTLWYACMLVLIVLLLFGFIFSISRSLLQRESDSRLEELVLDFADEIDFENGVYELLGKRTFVFFELVFLVDRAAESLFAVSAEQIGKDDLKRRLSCIASHVFSSKIFCMITFPPASAEGNARQLFCSPAAGAGSCGGSAFL